MRLLLLVALILNLSDCCKAQVELAEVKTLVWTGFDNPRIVDGKVISDATSKPKATATSQIVLKVSGGYEVKQVYCEEPKTGKYVDLIEAALGDDIELVFKPNQPPGDYRITAVAVKPGTVRESVKWLNVTIGGPAPTPDPTPEPDPVPPVPDGDAPIKEPGLRVLITYESQQPVPRWLQDADWRAMLNSLCATGPDGKTKEWRVVDKDSPSVANAGVWPAALEKIKGQEVPAILVSNGKTGVITKLPESKADAVALVKRYAEAK